MLDYDVHTPPRHSVGSQLAFLFMFTGMGIILGSLVTLFITGQYLHIPFDKIPEALTTTNDTTLLRILQPVTTFFVMAVPAIAFGLIMNRRPLQYIGFNGAISGKQFFLVIIIIVMGLLLSGSLSLVNEMLPLSKTAEAYFKNLENEYNKQMMGIANMRSVQDYILSLFIIALMPAIFEEMLFRGALQPILINLTKNAFAGILITSILFSAIHFSYYGFLPRLALGLIIGYTFYYSKNLWLASITHFLYNAIGVSQLYSLSRKGLLNPEAMNDDTISIYYGLFAAGALYGLFVMFKRESQVVISMYNFRKHKL